MLLGAGVGREISLGDLSLKSSDVTCISMQSIEIIRKLLKGLSDVYELISPVHNVFSANNQQRSQTRVA